MANRYVAYGYEITDGKMSVIDSERDIVENIFGMYINGNTLLEISNRLNQSGISYNNDGRSWNKNIIKRILDNKKYLGEEEYPQIIAQDTFNRAAMLKNTKAHLPNEKQKEINALYRTMLICGCCGKKLYKYKGRARNCNYANYRRCKNETCANPATPINDRTLNYAVIDILNDLIRNYDKIKADETDEIFEENPGVNLTEEINNLRNDVSSIVNSIVRAAEMRFEHCTGQDYTAIDENIKRKLSISCEKDEIDTNLVKDIVKSIRLYPNKVVEIELINGNKFTGGNKDDRRRV